MSDEPVRAKPSVEQLQRYADAFNRSTTLQFWGVRVHFPSQDRVEVHLDKVRPEQRGGLGTDAINGGVLAALFDLGLGCTPALIDPTRRNATIQLSMSFERPVRGDSMMVRAQIDNAGDTVLFSSAEALDARGVVCARCQGVVRLSKRPWKTGDSPAVN